MTANADRLGRVPYYRIFLDALGTLRSRPGRSIGLGLAIALGVATAIGILSISDAANASARSRIDARRPEIVRVRPLEPHQSITEDLPGNALVDASRDPRVSAVAAVQSLPESVIRTRPTGEGAPAAVMAIDGDLPDATRATLIGRPFTERELETGSRVAIVGTRVANTIELSAVTADPTIWIDGVPFAVVAIAEDSEHLGSITEAVLVPRNSAITYLGDAHRSVDTVIYVRTDRGAAAQAADDLPLWITPNRPEQWITEVPRSSLDLATEISEDLRALTLAMAGVVLFVGIVAIANAMTRAVYERIPEIGLRRTLGARSHQILLLLLTEAALIGTLAGVVGIIVGATAAVLIATQNQWPVALSATGIALALPVAILSGVIGGLIPSLAAIRITPSQALRRE